MARDKRNDVDAFVNGERIARNLLSMALKAKNPANSLDDVKRELRETFPTVEFGCFRNGKYTSGPKKGERYDG